MAGENKMRHGLAVGLMIVAGFVVGAGSASASLELTEVDIAGGMIELTNIGDTPFSGDLLEWCMPFVYGQLETSFTFATGESRVYSVGPGGALNDSEDLWIYLDRTATFGDTSKVTSGVVWGSDQSGAGRVASVVSATGGEAWADATDFVDTSGLGAGQTIQLIYPGDIPNASSGWTVDEANLGVFACGGLGDLDGDFDGNGLYEEADIDALVAAVAGGSTACQFDLDGNGTIEFADVQAWLAEAGAVLNANGNPILQGDANLDGVVDGTDFIRWNGAKFTAAAAWSMGDFTADGFVDGQDFIVWNTFKFQASDVAVPEPGTAALCWCGLLLLRRRNS